MGKPSVVVIPALNEEATIAQIVSEVRALGLLVIVVNDASHDRTSRIARDSGAEVLDLPCRLGAWGATQAGMLRALRGGYGTIVTLDGDGQHPPAHISALLAPVLSGNADIVIGSCVTRGSLARHLAWKLFQLLSGLALSDLTSGFRAYSLPAARAMLCAEATLADYQDLGILLLARRRNFRVLEVPVVMCPRAVGKSHIFSSWLKVARYMAYTITIACTRR
jgi:hypothetical protein